MRALLVALMGAVALAIVPGSAEAKVMGPCTATVAGASMNDNEVAVVQEGELVDYAFSAPTAVKSYSLQLTYGPFTATPSSGEVMSGETGRTGQLDLSKYAWLGVGLYDLRGTIVLQDGTTCNGFMQIDIQGNPLATAVGITAAIFAAGSTIGLILLFLKEGGILFGGPA